MSGDPRHLVEGNSVRAVARMTAVSKTTILKLIADLGAACEAYQNAALGNLSCKRIQRDEIWNFCCAKQKNVPAEKQGQFGLGDSWTWVAIDGDTKLVPTWVVGPRDSATAFALMEDLAGRVAERMQLTTDGLRFYADAVEHAFGANIDSSVLVKMYGNDGAQGNQARYSPAECTGTQVIPISGRPKAEHVSTSYVERQNLTMRMQMRRFTRLTNAFSKKIENLRWSVAIHFMHYNFCRIHPTLRVTVKPKVRNPRNRTILPTYRATQRFCLSILLGRNRRATRRGLFGRESGRRGRGLLPCAGVGCTWRCGRCARPSRS